MPRIGRRQDDVHACELARSLGETSLRDNGFDYVTIQISHNGRWLSPLKVSR